jgi:hypothetical protein
MNVLRTMQVRISSRNITRNANHSPLQLHTPHSHSADTRDSAADAPHAPHSVWQRLEFGKLMNEAGGVLAPPGQLIHEAACFRAAQPT